MIAKPASIFVFALAAFGAVSASPLTRRDDPPTGNLTGTAEYSYFDGTSACGTTLPADQPLVGIDGNLFNQITGPCGRQITITAPNGVTKQATIQESCGDGCSTNGLLLTTSLFSDFYNLAKGEFEATWHFN